MVAVFDVQPFVKVKQTGEIDGWQRWKVVGWNWFKWKKVK